MGSDAYQPGGDERREFEERLARARLEEERVPPVEVDGRPVEWFPQAGSQTDFIQASLFEVLYHGTRGPGKTDALLMAFASRVGRGHGAAWRGVIFRQTYPQLADIVAKSEKWFRLCFPGARFNRAKMTWSWPTGEELLFRHMSRPEDYWGYHGHEYPFIGWEELTNWASDACYKAMFSCCRCSTPGVPRMVRATTNPYGVGHNWVKARFRLHGKWWAPTLVEDARDEHGNAEPTRLAIHGHIDENKILLAADPDYKRTIVASATSKAMAEAWLMGSWDIVAGGMFDDVWDPRHNLVPEFPVPPGWYMDRSFDWGSSAPFSVGWWAESDGSDVHVPGRGLVSTVRGDLFRVAEWYGWNGRPNEGLRMLAVDIAKGIVERELAWGWRTPGQGSVSRVRAGPADSQIYDVENGVCTGRDMERPVRVGGHVYPGVSWTRGDKRPGSVAAGYEKVRQLMRDAHPVRGAPRERPGLFVVEGRCDQFVRTVPTLARDDVKMDRPPDKAEDHAADETRYRARALGQRPSSGHSVGMF